MSSDTAVRLSNSHVLIATSTAFVALSAPLQAAETVVTAHIPVKSAGLDIDRPAEAREF